jgi:hypothetical protein
MPQHHPNHPDPGLTPVPVALLLPPTRTPQRALTQPDSSDLTARTAGLLVATYTHAGDRIVDLDASPVLAQAAATLDRHIVTGNGHGPATARLICARLPRPERHDLSLPDLVEWMRDQRNALQRRGFLLTAVSADRRDGGYFDRATTVITAARTAGLIYHQHLIAVHTPLPEDEPLGDGGSAAACLAPHLPGGRYARVHSDFFVFTTAAGGHDA